MPSYEPDPKCKYSPSACGQSATPAAIRLAADARDHFARADRQSAGRGRRLWRELHDNDLIPIDATANESEQIKKDFKKALKDNSMVVPMTTTNLFSDPAFKDGAFTSNNARIRAYAIQKTMRAMELGAEFGAKFFVFWGGREGVESDATKSPVDAIKRFREAMNFLAEYSIEQKYGFKFAFEAKPNEPRGHIYFAVTGSYLAFIPTLDRPEMFGVNPEVAHEHMAGLNFVHQVAAALEQGKLFHIDLNDQEFGRFDQDYRFGSANLKHAFFLVKLLEDSKYNGPRHFDAHAYRQSDCEDVKEFAPRLHADLHDPEGKRRALERRQGDPGSAQADQCAGFGAVEVDEKIQQRQRQETAGGAAGSPRPGQRSAAV